MKKKKRPFDQMMDAFKIFGSRLRVPKEPKVDKEPNPEKAAKSLAKRKRQAEALRGQQRG